MDILLPARPPFSLASVVHSHGWIRLAPFAEVGSGEGLRSVVQLPSERVTGIHVTAEDNGVRVSTDSDLGEHDAAILAEMVTWMLGLDQDFSDFYMLCQNEPKLAGVEVAAKGRLLRSPTFFEDIVKTIMTTNTAWSGTIRMTNALVDAYGVPTNADTEAATDADEDEARAFPTPAALARTSEEDLRTTGKLGYRAPYVLELAQRVEAGDVDLDAFQESNLPTLDLRKQLLNIKGVGSYAAAILLMLLGRYDYLPVDSWARTLVSLEWYDGEPVGEKEIETAFADWSEWKGLAYWFWDWSEKP